MRATTHKWNRLGQLGRAFTVSHFPPASNAITSTFMSWSKVLVHGFTNSTARLDCKIGFARHFSNLNFGIFWLKVVDSSPRFYSWTLNQRCFKGRTHVSSAQSSESEYWDTPEDQSKLTRGNAKVVRGGDGLEWGQQHVRLWESETRQRPNLSSNPPPKFQQDDMYIPVKACYISRSLDLKRLSEEPFLEGFAEISCSQERYMVAFQYGSIVFFNFGDEEEEEALFAVRKFCTDKFRETRKDDYGVLIRPALSEWSQGGQDRIMLRMLDTDNIRVISSILGQSIALDHYAKKVDEMVNTFSELNRGMEKTGTFTMTRKSLFQLVAAANTTLADVILRLGLLERSDAAWKDANYAQIWEYLRDDFELDERFESLDFKLNIIQHNVRFFLEILQNRKSDTLEWIIILLITGEICVGVYQILLETNVL